MKNVVILHGLSETQDSFWIPWLTSELDKKGYTVSTPTLPDADHPDIKNWLPVALKETYTPETVLIGHSTGGALQLSVLEHINVQIKQAIIIAGYGRPIGKNEAEATLLKAVLQDSYNWQKIAENVEDIMFINSDNDPWGCTDGEGRYMLDQVGKGKLIIPKGEGHMGSDSYNQPYKEFPFLLKLID